MSPRLFPLAAILAASAVFPLAPAPAAETPATTAAAASAPVPPYQLKRRSEFVGTGEGGRAPFWPIGWVKRKKIAGVTTQIDVPVESARVLLDGKNFKVTSILLGSGTTPSLAVINGRAYSEGEFLRMPKGGATPPIRVRVQRISDGSVLLQNADQTLVANLQRPELSAPKAEELLLDPDR